eukprot:TRINITY_DN42038_c0_g1_i1.p1 TRINITY_DN42038_c0_g1~~TRINITY_DN42038_c0_g1_i1.p1  ORF type:complete len:748 (-),score=94.49 TRINITY_DN42038_c0_g1_i1:95-2338(-)
MSVSDESYATLGHSIFVATFQRTGCPNMAPSHGLLEKWRTLSDEQAWGEMYAYCIEALHGTGVLIQCCGWEACRPSQCIMQTKWSSTAADPTTSAAPTTRITTSHRPSTTTAIATTSEARRRSRRRSQPTSTPFAGESDSCAIALTACECAAKENCGWRWTQECYFIGWPNTVSCSSCPSQSRCATDSCNKWPTPCACASSDSSCAWDSAQGTCLSGVFETSCSSCPSQMKCGSETTKLEPASLVVLAFDPPSGSSLQDANAEISLEFNTQIDWCARYPDGFPASTSGVTFGCNDLDPVQIHRQSLKRQDDGLRLRIGVSDLLKQVSDRATGCGLVLPHGLICAATGSRLVFQGLQRDQYSFSLVAGAPPLLLSFQPKDQAKNVALDSTLTLTFNQNVILKDPPDQVASLTRMDAYNRFLDSNSVGLRLKPPEAMIDGTRLILKLSGKVQAGSRYTLSLPVGAVSSSSGNHYAGLWEREYTFETIAAKQEGKITDPGSSDGMSSSTIVLIGALGGSVCIFAVGVIMLWMACKMFLSKNFKQPSKRRVYPDDFSHVRNASGVARGTPVNAGWNHQQTYGWPSENWSHQAEKTGAADPRRMLYSLNGHDNVWSHQHVAADSVPRSSTWHQQQQHQPRSAETRKTRGPAASTRSSSAGPRLGSQESAPPGSGNRASGSAQRMPAKEVELCPEAKAVEARLRELMNEPLPARKKKLKELLVQYHPDRNETEHAKEVFQFVNNAKEWFLADA